MHHDFARSFREHVEDGEQIREQFLRSIREAPPSCVCLISTEVISGLSEQSLTEMVVWLDEHFDEVVCVSYVRAPHRLYPSRISQQLKKGEPLDSLRDPEKYRSGHRERLEMIDSAFGRERTRVFPFHSAELGGDLVSHFFRNIFPDVSLEGVEMVRTNESRAAATVITLMRLQAALDPTSPLDQETFSQARAILNANGSIDEKLPRLVPPEPWLAAIYRSHQEEGEWIANRYLGGDLDRYPGKFEGDIESEATPTREEFESWLLSHSSEEMAVSILAQVMKRMVERQNQDSIERLKKRLSDMGKGNRGKSRFARLLNPKNW